MFHIENIKCSTTYTSILPSIHPSVIYLLLLYQISIGAAAKRTGQMYIHAYQFLFPHLPLGGSQRIQKEPAKKQGRTCKPQMEKPLGIRTWHFLAVRQALTTVPSVLPIRITKSRGIYAMIDPHEEDLRWGRM